MLQLAPKISVVIPLYNKKAHIVRAVDSILNQTLAATEIIVVDYGSTDGSGEHLLATHSQHVRYIEQENGGVSRARNCGIAAARGDYVAFLDADDTWEPHFLAEVEYLIRHYPQASVFTTAYQFIEGDNNYVDPKIQWPKKPARSQILDNYFELSAKGSLPFMMSSVCVRKSEFDVIGTFPVDEPMGEDQELFANAAIRSTIAYSAWVSSFYHIEAENRACVSNIPAEECPFSKRLHEWAKQQDTHNQQKESVLDYTAAHLLHLASLNVKSKRLQPAKQLLSDARCRRNLPRFAWWYGRYLLARLSSPTSITA